MIDFLIPILFIAYITISNIIIAVVNKNNSQEIEIPSIVAILGILVWITSVVLTTYICVLFIKGSDKIPSITFILMNSVIPLVTATIALIAGYVFIGREKKKIISNIIQEYVGDTVTRKDDLGELELLLTLTGKNKISIEDRLVLTKKILDSIHMFINKDTYLVEKNLEQSETLDEFCSELSRIKTSHGSVIALSIFLLPITPVAYWYTKIKSNNKLKSLNDFLK